MLVRSTFLLVLQAEHGGGSNSTFTVRVTSSTGTDTYSSIAAGIGSLKGPLHGGANIQVADMFHHLQENIQDWTSVDEIDTYFTRMLNKEVYNKTDYFMVSDMLFIRFLIHVLSY